LILENNFSQNMKYFLSNNNKYKDKNANLQISSCLNSLIFFNIWLIILAILLIKYSNIDIILQKKFFYFNQWIISKDEQPEKLLFYNLPKIFLGICIVATLLFAIFFRLKNKNSPNLYRFTFLFLGLVLNPIFTANIKKFTNIHCPSQIKEFGGGIIYQKIISFKWQNKRGQCFPAGHAVTGFAFFIFCFFFRSKILKILSFLFALNFGWLIGFYQIMKGAHFFGDTIISMLLCFLLATIIAKIFNQKNLPYQY